LITLRRASERLRSQRGRTCVWRTFFDERTGAALLAGFGTLESLDESVLSPRAASQHQRQREGEAVTYVRAGALAYVNSAGHSGVVLAGEFQRVSGGLRGDHRETNASHAHRAHVYQIGLSGSEANGEPSSEQKRFNVADRRAVLCLVASPDARRGSMRVHHDAQIFSSILLAGQHVVHELRLGRCAWIHFVEGEGMVGGILMSTGDGAGISGEAAASVTAQTNCELLLVDVAELQPAPVDTMRRTEVKDTAPGARARTHRPGSSPRARRARSAGGETQRVDDAGRRWRRCPAR
jgi:hypothetical protein